MDHIAMPTAKAEALIAFYTRLGFRINDAAAWRAGTAHIFSIRIGDAKINVHPEGYTARLHGPSSTPGGADICLVWDGSVEACRKMLTAAGGAHHRGSGAAPGCPRRWRAPRRHS